MGASASAEKKSIRAGRRPEGLLPTLLWLEKLIVMIAGALGVHVSIQGARRSASGTDGEDMHFDIEPGNGAGNDPDHNWKTTVIDTTHVLVSPGTVLNAYPTIGAYSILDGPALTVADDETNYIYVHVTRTLNIVNGVVISHTITGRTVEAFNASQTETDTDVYFLVAIHDPAQPAASRITQTRYWSIGMLTQDDGTGTSTPETLTWVEA